MVVFGQIVVFGQKWLYLGKIGCIWAKVVVLELNCFFLAKVVVFGQSGRTRVKLVFSGKVVVFGQNGCIQAKMVL